LNVKLVTRQAYSKAPAFEKKEIGQGGIPVDGFIDRFVHQANLSIYRRQLAQTTDATRRRQLLQLLAEEERKEADHDRPERAA